MYYRVLILVYFDALQTLSREHYPSRVRDSEGELLIRYCEIMIFYRFPVKIHDFLLKNGRLFEIWGTLSRGRAIRLWRWVVRESIIFCWEMMIFCWEMMIFCWEMMILCWEVMIFCWEVMIFCWEVMISVEKWWFSCWKMMIFLIKNRRGSSMAARWVKW